MQGVMSLDKETHSFNTCPIELQWTLYQLQHVDMSVESHPVRTIHALPFKDLYNCCKFWHIVGFTVLLTVGISDSMDVDWAVSSDAIVDVAWVVSSDAIMDVAVGIVDVSVSMAVSVVSASMAVDVIETVASSSVPSSWQMAKATRKSKIIKNIFFILSKDKRKKKKWFLQNRHL